MMNRSQVVAVQASLPGLRINAKRASTRNYLRGLGNLCSSAAYNQGRLTLIFYHHFVRLTTEYIGYLGTIVTSACEWIGNVT